MTTTTYLVTGMSCDHCVHAVTEEVSRLPGVAEVAIDLAPEGSSRVTVTSDAGLDKKAVRDAVDEAGYDLVGVASP